MVDRVTEYAYPASYPKTKGAAKRQSEMKVLCLGMSRTGTLSMNAALTQLGYTTYHNAECLRDTMDNNAMARWVEAIDAKYNGVGKRYISSDDFDKLLWRHDAVTDCPPVLFVDELLAAYPKAQIVLTTRDVETWIPSMERLCRDIAGWKRWYWLQLFDRRLTAHYIPYLRSVLNILTNNRPSDRDALRAGYFAHNEHVRKAAASQGREVLEFHVKEGWEPLCKFLGREVPKQGFPHVNEGTWIEDVHYKMFWRITMLVAIKLVRTALVVGALGLGGWWLKNKYYGSIARWIE